MCFVVGCVCYDSPKTFGSCYRYHCFEYDTTAVKTKCVLRGIEPTGMLNLVSRLQSFGVDRHPCGLSGQVSMRIRRSLRFFVQASTKAARATVQALAPKSGKFDHSSFFSILSFRKRLVDSQGQLAVASHAGHNSNKRRSIASAMYRLKLFPLGAGMSRETAGRLRLTPGWAGYLFAFLRSSFFVNVRVSHTITATVALASALQDDTSN